MEHLFSKYVLGEFQFLNKTLPEKYSSFDKVEEEENIETDVDVDADADAETDVSVVVIIATIYQKISVARRRCYIAIFLSIFAMPSVICVSFGFNKLSAV